MYLAKILNNQSFLGECIIEELSKYVVFKIKRDNLFTPCTVMKAMDLSGGTLNFKDYEY